MKIVSRVVLALFLLTGLSSSALAGSKADPVRVKAARKACLTGDLTRGIDILADLYLETNDITFIYNQGRCYQQNHRWVEAVDRFEEFLRKSPNLGLAERAEVNGYIADCRSRALLAPSAPRPGTPVAPAPLPPPIDVTGGHVAPAAGTNVSAKSVPAARPGSRLRIAGITAGAVGLAALVTGVILDVKTHSIVDDVNRNGYDAGKLSTRDSYETWGWVSYGVGTAGVLAGAALYWLGLSADRSKTPGSAVSLVPVVDSRGAMLLLQGGIR